MVVLELKPVIATTASRLVPPARSFSCAQNPSAWYTFDMKEKEVVSSVETLPQNIEVLGRSIEFALLDNSYAICVIRPEAMRDRIAIKQRLTASGLYIAQSTVRDLPEDFATNELYRGLPKPIEEAMAHDMLAGPVEIILVRADNVETKLLDIVGHQTNPSLCNPETIRYIYGDHIPKELRDNLKLYRNAAHRSKGKEEIKKDLDKFKKLL